MRLGEETTIHKALDSFLWKTLIVSGLRTNRLMNDHNWAVPNHFRRKEILMMKLLALDQLIVGTLKNDIDMNKISNSHNYTTRGMPKHLGLVSLWKRCIVRIRGVANIWFRIWNCRTFAFIWTSLSAFSLIYVELLEMQIWGKWVIWSDMWRKQAGQQWYVHCECLPIAFFFCWLTNRTAKTVWWQDSLFVLFNRCYYYYKSVTEFVYCVKCGKPNIVCSWWPFSVNLRKWIKMSPPTQRNIWT